MKNTIQMLAAAILSVIALSGALAQTPAPAPTPDPIAGTFRDGTLPTAQRVDLALAIIASGTANDQTTGAAVSTALNVRPVLRLLEVKPKFADGVVADPTLGGKTTDKNVWGQAVDWNTDVLATEDAKIDYLKKQLAKAPAGYTVLNLAQKLGNLNVAKARRLLKEGQADAALTLALAQLTATPDNATHAVFDIKIATRATDAVSWSKAFYRTRAFAQTNAGIAAVASAYRLKGSIADGNEVIKWNTFGAVETVVDADGKPVLDDKGKPKTVAHTDPLAGVELPALPAGVPFFVAALDPVAELKNASVVLAKSNGSEGANNAAVAKIAAALRNIDGNTVRANAYIKATSEGKTYDIPELH